MMTEQPIALLGGTFNPPHKGHIAPALEAIREIGVTRLGLMPCKIPPHKSVAGISEAHRVNMVHAVCEGDDSLYPELIELTLPSPSFTVQTLRELRHRHPDTTVYFLIGYDSLYNLTSWHQWQQLTEYCHLIVMRREGVSDTLSADLSAFIHARTESSPVKLAESTHGNVYFADTGLHPVSSTLLRDIIASTAGEQPPALAKEWLAPGVIDYIYKHQLYQKNQ